MARTEQVTCDVCRAQKQKTNHWFVVLHTDAPSTDVWVMGDVEWKAYLSHSEPDYERVRLFDCCGEACVIKKVSELISPK